MRRRLVALLVVVSAVLAGCSALNTVIDTDRALRDAGYQSVKVSPNLSSNSLSVQVTVAAVPSRHNVEDVGSIVWRTFHERFDYVDITVHGTGPERRERVTFAQMVEAYGQRNPSWNSTTVKSGTERIGLTVIAAIVVVLALVVGIILLARRRSRRRGPPWQGPYPGGGYPGGAGGYPGGPGGYPGGPGGYPGGPGGYPGGPPPAHPPPAHPPWGSPPRRIEGAITNERAKRCRSGPTNALSFMESLSFGPAGGRPSGQEAGAPPAG